MSGEPPPVADWPRLLGLLDEALDLAPEQRPAWLDALALPAGLHAEMLRLLEERRGLESADFMAALPALPVAAVPVVPGGVLAPGVLLGPWRLLRELGQGGMSVVWLAERADGEMQRPVALKLPHAGPGQDLLARRMLRERGILAALEHPHIARLYDVGRTEQGTPYFVMEYVQGRSLTEHADATGLSLHQRLALFQQVLLAVQYAHSKLVLHRDLKPANILVTAAGTVKLLDFGIARHLRDAGSPTLQPGLTQTSTRLFTPSYASPEQLRGELLGTPSDLYSLGVVLYELLCGTRPHAHPGDSAAQLEAAVLNDEPVRVSRVHCDAATAAARGVSPKALAQALRGDLDAVLGKALASAPADRYASAEALAAEIDNHLRGLPVRARPRSRRYVLSKFLRRHRVGVALGSTAGVAVLAAAGVAFVQGQAAEQANQRAIAASSFLLELFAEAAPDRRRGEGLTAAQLLEQGRQKVQAQLPAQPRLQAELLVGIGQTQIQMREFRNADAALAEAAEIYRRLGDSRNEASARLFRQEAAMADERFDDAALRLAELAPLHAVIFSDRWLRLRWLRQSAGVAFAEDANAPLHKRADVAKFIRDSLQQCAEQADLNNPQETSVAWQCRIDLSGIAHRDDPALAEAQLRLAESLPLPQTAIARADRAMTVALRRAIIDEFSDRHAKLLHWLPDSIAQCEQTFGSESPRCADLKLRRIWALLRMGDREQLQQRSLELTPLLKQRGALYDRFSAAYVLMRADAAMGLTGSELVPAAVLQDMLQPDAPEHLPVAFQLPAMANLALWRLRAGDLPQAQAWLQRARALLAQQPAGRLSAEAASVDSAQGMVLQAQGRHAEALALLGPACVVGPPGPLGRSLGAMNCVRSLVATGQQERAEALMRDAVADMTKSLGAQAPNTVRAQQLLQQLQRPGHREPPWEGRLFYLSGMR